MIPPFLLFFFLREGGGRYVHSLRLLADLRVLLEGEVLTCDANNAGHYTFFLGTLRTS